MLSAEIKASIQTTATITQLDPDLIAAIVMTESAGNRYALRYEEHWRYFLYTSEYAMKLGITELTERRLQCFSYGLMQIMGSVARELGFADSLIVLMDVEKNLLYGSLKLKQFISRWKSIPDAVSSYNQGGPVRDSKGLGYRNQAYVDRVMRFYDQKLISSDREGDT